MPIQETVARIAPEVDRLVWALAPSIPDDDRKRLNDAATDAGLDGLWYIPNFAEFFLGPGISLELALTRQPYADPSAFKAWFRSLGAAGLIEEAGTTWVATHAGGSLFSQVAEVQTVTTNLLWGDHMPVVTGALAGATAVVERASPDHSVAHVHREVPLPPDRTLALYRRLVTLRYIRQHDHMAAWTATGLTAQQMVVLTELWHGGVVEESPALATLVEAGLVHMSQSLTERGRVLREGIEDDTNDRNAEDFAVLGEDGCTEFLGLLSELPPVS